MTECIHLQVYDKHIYIDVLNRSYLYQQQSNWVCRKCLRGTIWLGHEVLYYYLGEGLLEGRQSIVAAAAADMVRVELQLIGPSVLIEAK